MVTVQAPQARRGRPPHDGGGGIYGYAPGVHLAWAAGEWRGTPRLVAYAETLCEQVYLLPVPGVPAPALVASDRFDPVAAMAVIAAAIGPDAVIEGDVPGSALDAVTRAATIDLDDID